MKILEFPELLQTYNYDCGAKALQAVLAYYGIEIGEKEIIKNAKTTKSGTPINGIAKTARKYKLKVKSKTMTIDEIKSFIDKKIPVIIILQAWTKKKKVKWKKDWSDGHYVVVIGYDKKKIYFEDPSSFKRTYLTYKELKSRWHDVDNNGKKYFNHGIAIYGKKPCFDLKSIKHMN